MRIVALIFMWCACYFSYISYYEGISTYDSLNEYCSRQGWRMAEMRQQEDEEQVGGGRNKGANGADAVNAVLKKCKSDFVFFVANGTHPWGRK